MKKKIEEKTWLSILLVDIIHNSLCNCCRKDINHVGHLWCAVGNSYTLLHSKTDILLDKTLPSYLETVLEFILNETK